MRITTSSNHDTISLTLCGRLDFNARHEFKPAIQECYESRQRNIILDLEGITFIDSSGLGMIHRCITEAETKNIKVTLRNPQRQVHDIFELCNMTQYISSPLSQDQSSSSTHKPNPNVLTRDALSIIE